MTLWNPIYRVQIDGQEVTSATLAGLTISSGRNDIYAQPQAGYCNLSLLETNETPTALEINDSLIVEVKDSTGTFVPLFGGFVTDISIEVATSGSVALSQRINIIGVGALARLARTIYTGNIASDQDGDQIYSILETVLLDSWNEVPALVAWDTYDPTTTWANAENTGLGEIDRPGNYDLDSQNNVNQDVLSLVGSLATSGLGYVYETADGQIGYADSDHRTSYLAANGYTELDGSKAIGSGLTVAKRSGDVRNSVTISYTSSGNSTFTATDQNSVADFGSLASNIRTFLKNATDAEAQANFYLSLRAFPAYEVKSMTFEIQSPEIDNAERDALLGVFMGLPLHIINLPGNMAGGEFEGFVEGWTWSSRYNGLTLTLNLSPSQYSIQATRWANVSALETWNTLSPTLDWLNATIVA